MTPAQLTQREYRTLKDMLTDQLHDLHDRCVVLKRDGAAAADIEEAEQMMNDHVSLMNKALEILGRAVHP